MKNKKRTFRGSLSFNAAPFRASVRLSHAGTAIAAPKFADTVQEKIAKAAATSDNTQSFGSMWSGMNDPKFLKDIKMSDIIPQDEDFVNVPYRLLSATVVGAGTWKATDFTDEKMLKKSTQMLADKPVYKDHEMDLDNWVGLVKNPTWTKSFTDSKGLEIPAGIDGFISIDIKTNPKVARGVLLGSIYSNSVTVEFEWEMSHHFEDIWEFRDRVGTMAEDGTMIRRVVTLVTNYHESSLVWLGADPFAKAIEENGDLKHIDVGSVFNFSKDTVKYTAQEKEELKNSNSYTINFSSSKNLLSLKSTNSSTRTKQKQNKISMENKFIAAFISKFGVSVGLTKAHLQDENFGVDKISAALTKLQSTDSESDKLNADNAALVALLKTKVGDTDNIQEFLKTKEFVGLGKVAELDAKIVSLSADAAIGKTYSEAQRTEAIRLYKVTVGDKVDENVVNLFKDASPKAVAGLVAQYTKGATAKFSGKCGQCGSEDFTFQSSVNTKDEEVENTTASHTLTYSELYDNLKGDTFKTPLDEK